MNEKELQDLLQQVDQRSALPGWSDDLAERVRKKVRRRRQNKRKATTAIVLLLCVSTVGLLTLNTKREAKDLQPTVVADRPGEVAKDSQESQEQIAALQTDVKQLEKQINERMAFLEKILAQQAQRNRLAELERKLAALGDPLEKMKRQMDDVALAIYYQANRKLTELNLREDAVAEFRQVIRLFPESIWAEKAQEKLQELNSSSRRFFDGLWQSAYYSVGRWGAGKQPLPYGRGSLGKRSPLPYGRGSLRNIINGYLNPNSKGVLI